MQIEIEGLSFDIRREWFTHGVDFFEMAKYLKTRFKNSERAFSRVLLPIQNYASAFNINLKEDMRVLKEAIDHAPAFSYKEAFEIEMTSFRALVFAALDVSEMMQVLGTTRIKTEGKQLKNRKYNEDGSYELVDYSVIYELHRVDCSKLDVEDSYALKCWCTSTNKEHWMWVPDEAAENGPLASISSLCMVWENIKPHVKTIKRQGDVYLFEMDEDIVPSGPLVAFTAEEYFSLLVSQS